MATESWNRKYSRGQHLHNDEYALELLRADPSLLDTSVALDPPSISRSSSLTDYDNHNEIQPNSLRRRTSSLQNCYPNISGDLLRKKPLEQSFAGVSDLRTIEWNKRRCDSDFPFSAVRVTPNCRKRGDNLVYSPQTFCRCISAIIVAYIAKSESSGDEETTDTQNSIFDSGSGSHTCATDIARQLCVSPTNEPTAIIAPVPPPSVRTVYSFLHSLYVNAQVEHECLLIMLVYIERALHGNNAKRLCLTKSNWKAVLLTAIMLASKVWDDFSMINVDFSVVCSAGGNNISLSRLNELESRFLQALDYRVFITGPEYAQIHLRLQALVGEAREGQSAVLSENKSDSNSVKRPRLVRLDSETVLSRNVLNSLRIVSPQTPAGKDLNRDSNSTAVKLPAPVPVDIHRPNSASASSITYPTCPADVMVMRCGENQTTRQIAKTYACGTDTGKVITDNTTGRPSCDTEVPIAISEN
mmetsp:Transcript_14804/g.22297  ORF Transcript_14804/g.22297 Transcript_14804/m.22297 type:complete len:471 (+) Transcript_14804:120-1532(+)|eukprot:CAMPEP_0185017792 /NCGR_PEP_ID=MMETSP1103-20130426/684_1 /TAXON_ID=36769 /ORGANISM="Paraphysomonas bandaiensis, Strain Caron Lab Isolate" /LENGTH=470 /DNA_ID=CAMNT_0027547367 /DNA_START=120 /DNA_END=1532 /DNA_ORIENTATION=+